MGSAKKDAGCKVAGRPCTSRGLSNAARVPTTSSATRHNNGPTGKITKARSKKSRYAAPSNKNVDNLDDYDYPEPSRTRSEEVDDNYLESEGELEIDDDSDEEFTIISNVKSNNTAKSRPKHSSKNKDRALPDPNGRVKGRDLVTWTRPRMIEKLLLHLQYECELAGIDLPWDAAIKRLHPGSRDSAALQHLVKLRTILLTEGHMVPPKVKTKNKKGPEYSPELRGFIRPHNGGPFETRIVGWNEKVEDRSKNIENPEIIRGSGRYPRKNGRPVKAAFNSGKGRSQRREHTSDSGTPALPKAHLMITLDVHPKHLAQFPAGTGRVHNDKDNRSPEMVDQTVADEEDKFGSGEDYDFDGNEDGGSDNDEESDYDRDEKEDQCRSDFSIKREDINEETVVEVNCDNLIKTRNGLNDGLPDSEGRSIKTKPEAYGHKRMLSFEAAVGSLAGRTQFDMVAPAFAHHCADGFGNGLPTYSSVTFGQVLDPHNMYNDPSIIGSDFNGLRDTSPRTLATGRANDRNLILSNERYQPCLYYQTSDEGTVSTLDDVKSGDSWPGTRHESYSHPNDFVNLQRQSSPKSVPIDMSDFLIATDDTATEQYNFTPLPVYPQESRLNFPNVGFGPGYDKENHDVDDPLYHNILPASRFSSL